MSVDLPFLVRRWPERRPVVLGAAALGFAVAFAATAAADDPAEAVGILNVLPVILVALELGLGGGLAAAAAAVVLVIGADAFGTASLDTVGLLTRSVAFAAAGAIAGRFSDRMRQARARARLLVDSGFALAELHDAADAPHLVAEAALRLTRAEGVVVAVDDLPRGRAGRESGGLTEIAVTAPGGQLGWIAVRHRHTLGAEERAALELLALQCGGALDNLRLAEHEREAAVLEEQLTRLHADVLEERSGLGRLLDAQEDERRRVAERLHEDLAQMLAAVLLGLRMLRRGGEAGTAPLDELHDQVVGVLRDVREVAASLRPGTLEQIGLTAALEALAGREGREIVVTATGVHELGAPLQTTIYRLVEGLVDASPPAARFTVKIAATADGADIDMTLPPDQPYDSVRAARSRAAAMNGTLRIAPSIDDAVTRVEIGVPSPA
jgi:two-component system, NarL family, sensor histidine kinase UhpB